MEELDELEEIRRWLASIGKDRKWLAEQCGVSKRTVDGWFSRDKDRKMPKLALEFIRRIMRDNALGELRMTFDEWDEIRNAMDQSGYNRFDEFAIDVLKTHVAEKNGPYNDKPAKKTAAPPAKKNYEKAG